MATTIYADYDTTTLEAFPNTNYGSQTTLAVRGYTGDRGYGYIHFDISAWVGKTLSQGTLKYYIATNNLSADTRVRFKRAATSWTESGLVWNDPMSVGSQEDGRTLSASDTGWMAQGMTDTLQELLDNGCCGLRIALDAYDIIIGSSEGSYCPKIELTELIVNDYYAKVGGNDALDGKSWANAWGTIHKIATTLTDGQTGHIGFGNYTAEPAANKIAPQNVGASGIYYLPETATTGGGTGTVSVEQNS